MSVKFHPSRRFHFYANVTPLFVFTHIFLYKYCPDSPFFVKKLIKTFRKENITIFMIDAIKVKVFVGETTYEILSVKIYG